MEGYNIYIIIGTGMAGLLAGFVIGWLSRTSTGSGQQRLTEDLQKTQQELEQYRQEVGGHFTRTAELVGEMTAQYRAVYEHLADGAQRLGGDQAVRLEAAIIQGESLLDSPARKDSVTAAAEESKEDSDDKAESDEQQSAAKIAAEDLAKAAQQANNSKARTAGNEAEKEKEGS